MGWFGFGCKWYWVVCMCVGYVCGVGYCCWGGLKVYVFLVGWLGFVLGLFGLLDVVGWWLGCSVCDYVVRCG